jgi:iron complex transport system substrate-binding protein
MMEKYWQLLWCLGFFLLFGCESTTVQRTQQDCQVIEHDAGETCVPDEYERLVTLDSVSFANAIALEVQPVGTVTSDFSRHLQAYSQGVQKVGQAGEPNLETVLTLKPDLILGLDYHQSIYNQVQQIAPTLLLPFRHSGHWKETFQRYSQVLDREEKAEAVMAEYKQRVTELQSAIQAEYSQSPTVSVIRIYPDGISLYLRDSFPGTILADVGLPRPPSQDLSATEANKIANNPIQKLISRELIPEADGDIIFIWTGENTVEGKQQAQKQLTQLQADPLWQKLTAVQKGRVYQVPSYWIGSSPIAANLVIDDLFQYLVKD